MNGKTLPNPGTSLHILNLQIEDFRNLESIDINPHKSLNLFSGENGAGKTSILESLVVLAKGRSFRTPQAAELVRVGQTCFRVVAQLRDETGTKQRLGLERNAQGWRARRNGQDVKQISELAEGLPLVIMEPNSHLLVNGPPEGRRKFLDWGVFHVEPGYLASFRRYTRALKQRNAALRLRQFVTIEGLDVQLLEAAAHINRARRAYTKSLAEPFARLVSEIGLSATTVGLRYRQGWAGESLEKALETSKTRDIERGMTGPGPHRADLGLVIEGISARNQLSRGEQKTLAAALVLAQASCQAERGATPLILLDDLASEFDTEHLHAVLKLALAIGGQVWLCGTTCPDPAVDHKLFHVEHGKVSELV